MENEKNLLRAWAEEYRKYFDLEPAVNYIKRIPANRGNTETLKRHIKGVEEVLGFYKTSNRFAGVRNFASKLIKVLEKRLEVAPAPAPKKVNNWAAAMKAIAEEEKKSRSNATNSIIAFNAYKGGYYRLVRNYMTNGKLPENTNTAKYIREVTNTMLKWYNSPNAKRGLPESVNKLYRGLNSKYTVPVNRVVNNRSFTSWSSNKRVANLYRRGKGGIVYVLNKRLLGNIPYKNFGTSDPEHEYLLPPIRFVINEPYVNKVGRLMANVKSVSRR